MSSVCLLSHKVDLSRVVECSQSASKTIYGVSNSLEDRPITLLKNLTRGCLVAARCSELHAIWSLATDIQSANTSVTTSSWIGCRRDSDVLHLGSVGNVLLPIDAQYILRVFVRVWMYHRHDFIATQVGTVPVHRIWRWKYKIWHHYETDMKDYPIASIL